MPIVRPGGSTCPSDPTQAFPRSKVSEAGGLGFVWGEGIPRSARGLFLVSCSGICDRNLGPHGCQGSSPISWMQDKCLSRCALLSPKAWSERKQPGSEHLRGRGSCATLWQRWRWGLYPCRPWSPERPVLPRAFRGSTWTGDPGLILLALQDQSQGRCQRVSRGLVGKSDQEAWGCHGKETGDVCDTRELLAVGAGGVP